MSKWVWCFATTILNAQRLQYACVHAHMHTHCQPHTTPTPTHTDTQRGVKMQAQMYRSKQKTIIICIFSSLAVGIWQFTLWCTHNHVISSSISGGTHSRRRFVQLTCISWHSQRGSTFEHANTIIKNNDVTLCKC
jgi:hypothetical protein